MTTITPTLPLTTDSRIEAVLRFGYTLREAEFLCLAALHGGYFVRQQYARFLGKSSGGTVSALTDKALARGHVKVSTFACHLRVYHVSARSFYGAIAQGDNRNRRERQAFTIQNKLMGLDYVLANPELTFLATEHEKVAHLTQRCGVAVTDLPAKCYRSSTGERSTVRYFVDKFPIGVVAAGSDGAGSTVRFCFVDEGAVTVSRFKTYLVQYARLFGALEQFELLYAAATPRLFGAAERAFRHVVDGRPTSDDAGSDARQAQRIAYFHMRALFESGAFDSFDRAKLIALRNARHEFSGSENEARYARWKAGAPAEPADVPVVKSVAPRASGGRFSTCLLEHSYELFGNLTAF